MYIIIMYNAIQYSKSIELLELWKMRSIQVDDFSISIIVFILLFVVVILFALIYFIVNIRIWLIASYIIRSYTYSYIAT